MFRLRTFASTPLDEYADARIFGPAEIHSAVRIVTQVFSTLDALPTVEDYLAVAVAVWAPSNGHVCADLSTVANVAATVVALETDDAAHMTEVEWPVPDEWLRHLRTSPLVSVADEGSARTDRPLVLHGSKLYLTRQWAEEGQVADTLSERFSRPEMAMPDGAEQLLDRIFTDRNADGQRHAVEKALRNNTFVLLGGPGTGKTFSITSMLGAILATREAAIEEREPLRIALAAPTAKAARQIGVSIEENIEKLRLMGLDESVTKKLVSAGREASTIHRLLGTRGDKRGRFVHDRHNPLPYDVVVVDETSMISLSLMDRLLDALRPETRLILVGDGEQLKSVENGAVLPEISLVAAMNPKAPIVTLRHNFRQQDSTNETTTDNPIRLLAELVRSAGNGGDGPAVAEAVMEKLRTSASKIHWISLTDQQVETFDPLLVIDDEKLNLKSFENARDLARTADAHMAIKELGQVRVLCGHRRGPFGVRGWNEAISKRLGVPLSRTAPGLPLLNTRNDLRTGLVNGDTGIVVARQPSPRACFSLVDSDGKSRIEEFEPTSLEAVDECFAMTVHKAQGSQYQTTVVVCPPPTSPLSTRELFYTAITRAIDELVIIGSEESIKHAIVTSIPRQSGLAERISTHPVS